MILHITPDSRFLDIAYNDFEGVFPGENKFVVISRYKNLKNSKKKDVIVCKPYELCSKRMFDLAQSSDAVIVHYLDYHSALFISSLPFDKKILWVGWGGDYQELINKYGDSENWLPATADLCKRQKNLRSLFVYLAFLVRNLWWQKRRVFKRAIEKIDFFAPVLPSEYDLVKSRIKYFNADFVSWNYGTIEDFVPNVTLFEGNDILVGNSATPSNNHIDAFMALKNVSFAGRVIVPLSYGDVRYAKKVIEIGKQMFGRNFLPILGPLPIDEYSDLVKNCSFAIMNQIRQQAVGNIILMLYSGASVFFQKKNPVYVFFKRMGARVFDIADFVKKREIETFRLSISEVEANRRILSQMFGSSNKRKKTLQLIELLKC